MNLLTIIITAVGLAMDCFAVAVSAGTTGKHFKPKNLLVMALYFGGFQSAMVLAGWSGGSLLVKFISRIDHWVAFGLLVLIGGKMLIEAMEFTEHKKTDYTDHGVMLLLSIATSIDALAIGVGFSFLKSGLGLPVLCIGTAAFLFTLLGGAIGKRTGELLGKRAEIAGGLILIGMGVKILIEHLSAEHAAHISNLIISFLKVC
jgi:manganese efflux pump family protein